MGCEVLGCWACVCGPCRVAHALCVCFNNLCSVLRVALFRLLENTIHACLESSASAEHSTRQGRACACALSRYWYQPFHGFSILCRTPRNYFRGAPDGRPRYYPCLSISSEEGERSADICSARS